MPLLQYQCPKCNKKFERIVPSHTAEVVCPNCNVPAKRDYTGSMYSATGKQSKKCSGNCKTCSGCR